MTIMVCLMIFNVLICTRKSNANRKFKSHTGLVGDVAVEITKWKDVALSKLKMDCRCRKLSLSFRQFLSALSVLEQDCRYILSNLKRCRLSPKPLGRP